VLRRKTSPSGWNPSSHHGITILVAIKLVFDSYFIPKLFFLESD